MLRSRALRSRVRVSTRDAAVGSRLPALLALPHPQPFLRTIFARGSLGMEIWEAATRARYKSERLIADKKEAGGVRIASDSRGAAGEGQALSGCLRRSGGCAEA